MIVVGAVRAALTWLLTGYLLAVATVLVPALALTRLLSPDPAERYAGVAALLVAGPVTGLVAAWGTSRGVGQGAAFAGAVGAPPDLVAAVGRACRARHVRPPVCWTAPGLDASAPPVVVRALRSGHAYLPATFDARTVDDLGAAVARSVADGGASALLSVLAVCRWWRVWVDAVRLCGAPVQTVRRGRASDGAAGGAALVQVLLLPFLLLAALCAVPAWIAARIACLAVAPARLRGAARVFGTPGGTPRAVQEVSDPESFADVMPWAAQRTLGVTHASAVPVGDAAPGRGRWGRPGELGAGFAGQPLASLALAMMVLAPAVGFAGAALTEHAMLPGEQRVTAVVGAAQNEPDDALLVDLSENSRVTVEVPGTRWSAAFATSRSGFAVGDRVGVAVARDADPAALLTDVRWPDRRTVQRSVAFAVLPVLLAWGVVVALGRVGGQAIAAGARTVRARQEELIASRDGTDPAGAAAVRARYARRAAGADRRRAWVLCAVGSLVPAFLVGWLGSAVGRGIGGLAGHADGGRQLGLLVAAGLAYAGCLLLARVAIGRAAAAAAARAAGDATAAWRAGPSVTPPKP